MQRQCCISVTISSGDGLGEIEHVVQYFNWGFRQLVLSTMQEQGINWYQEPIDQQICWPGTMTYLIWYNFIIMFSYTSKPLGQQLTQSVADFQARKSRVFSSTNAHFQPKEIIHNRLPELTRSSSTAKSTKLKLTTIEATLSTIYQDLQTLITNTRQSRRFCNFLKDELGSSQLGLLKLELQNATSKLDKLFKTSKKRDEDRSHLIKVDCDKLREGSKKLAKMMQLLRNKLDNCETVMGVSSGKEKHLK